MTALPMVDVRAFSPARSAIEVAVSSVVTEPEWDAYAESHPDASGYHLWRWRSVFERAFGHRCEYLAARRNGDIVGVLPLVLFKSWLFGRFVVSLPFVNYGGLVAADRFVARALLDHATAVAVRHRASHLELRHRGRVFPDLPAKHHKVAMLLDLPPEAGVMWERLDRKVRNQIRKAEKSGLEVATGGPELVNEFYSVFASNMRDLGTPVYSRRFFEQVLEQFPERTRVWIVRLETTPVAGGISYVFRQTIEVPWAASLRAYRTLCPNNLLYWSVIRDAIAQGLTRLDFGRSTPEEGTFQFKRQWRAEPEPLCWEYRLLKSRQLPDQSPKNPKFRNAIAMWRQLPMPVTTLVGPRIVRSIP